MSTFQNHVYTVISETTSCILGTFPNFKKAYERIEELADGATIYDLGYSFNLSKASFEIVVVKKAYGRYYFTTNRYTIYESLLTIFSNDITISPDMFAELENVMKENRRKNAKYKLKTEVM